MRILAAFVLAVSVLALACGSSSGASATLSVGSTVSSGTGATSPVTTAKTAAGKTGNTHDFGQTVDFDGELVTVAAYKEDAAASSGQSQGDKTWTALVTIKNGRSEPVKYGEGYVMLVDAKGKEHAGKSATGKAALGSGSLEPGQTVKGYVAWRLSSGQTPDHVKFDSWVPSKQGDWSAVWQ
jgi:hypothetical protein